MIRDEFRFAERLRVRWAEIDSQRIVFNGHYLMYFDTAIAGYWRALAMPYHQTLQSLDGDLFVRKATVEYLGSARYDDVLDVGVRCRRIGTSSITFECGVFRQASLLVSGELVYVFANPEDQKSRPVPESLRAALQSFESGNEVLRVEVGHWAVLGADASSIRKEVFIQEQNIPAALEWDTVDAAASHAVAYNSLGAALGTGRLFVDATGAFRIGRMAVLGSMRHAGVGRALLDRLVELARLQGASSVVLSAQVSALRFYARAGFAEEGQPFDEAGIAHVEMRISL